MPGIPAANARDIGQTFAEAVRGEPAVRQLCVRPYPGGVELWLVTAPIDPDKELALHAASRLLYERFPDAEIDVHIINERHYPHLDAARIIPTGAKPIPLHATGEAAGC